MDIKFKVSEDMDVWMIREKVCIGLYKQLYTHIPP